MNSLVSTMMSRLILRILYKNAAFSSVKVPLKLGASQQRTTFSRFGLLQCCTDNSNSCLGYTYSHFGVKVKWDHVVFSLVFKIGPSTAISMERALFSYQWKAFWRELSIDMAVLINSENPTWSRFTITPIRVQVYPEQELLLSVR